MGKFSMLISDQHYHSTNNGRLSVPLGSVADYLLATAHANINRVTEAQWIYRNRRRMSKDVLKLLRKFKSSRELLKKYKVK